MPLTYWQKPVQVYTRLLRILIKSRPSPMQIDVKKVHLVQRNKDHIQPVRLKEKAEAFLGTSRSAAKKMPHSDIRKLIEDMLVYQSELEEQNRDLVKNAEEAATETETFYRRLAESATDLICVIDKDGFGFDYVSPSIAAMSGYTINEILNLSVNDVLAPDSLSKILEVLEREIEKEKRGRAEPQRLELEGIKKDGARVWIEVSVRFLRDGGGQVSGILCVAREITKRKQEEYKLKESEEKFRHLITHMTDGLAVQNDKGVLTFVNDSFCEISGYPSHEAVGMGVMDFLDEKNQKILQGHIDNRKQGLPAESYELELTRKDRTKISLFVSPKGLYASDGTYKGSFAIFSDITFLKLTENMLLETQKQLEDKVKERTRELEEKNVALKVLLTQRENDKKKLEDTMMSNVKDLLLPNLSRLKHDIAGSKYLAALGMLEANLNEIISPFADNGSALVKKLTPMEMQVANFIKHGASTKDIAESLGLSRRTVDTHRYNIRKKIGIRGKGVNLRTYLSNLL